MALADRIGDAFETAPEPTRYSELDDIDTIARHNLLRRFGWHLKSRSIERGINHLSNQYRRMAHQYRAKRKVAKSKPTRVGNIQMALPI